MYDFSLNSCYSSEGTCAERHQYYQYIFVALKAKSSTH